LQELRNFEAIIKSAKEDKRFKLCLGNHDYHYLCGIPRGERYSRFEDRYKDKIRSELEDNMELFKIVRTTKDKYLISHAGGSRTFMRNISISSPEKINGLFKKDSRLLRFNGRDIFGNDVTQGPLWIRPDSLLLDRIDDWTQIVGHTQFPEITRKDKVIFIDTGSSAHIYRF